MATLEVVIEKIVHGGIGLGQVEGKRVLVPLVAPGERVRVNTTEEHPHYVRARLVEVLEPHPHRHEAPCPYFGRCGGCDFQFLPHPEQLAAKKSMVADAFRRIGRMDVGTVLHDPEPVCPEFRYRNRIRLSYGDGGRVGLVQRASNKVVPIDACLLMPDVWNQAALPWLKTLPTADRASFRVDTGGRMIAAVTGHPRLLSRLSKRMAVLEKGEPAFPGALGVLFNAKPIRGTSQFEVDCAGRRFQVGSGSFFQVNYEGAEALVRTADRMIGDGGGILVDLYAGVGTFAIALAGKFERVIGVEIARSGVRDFRKNIEVNQVANVELLQGSVEKVLPDVVSGLPEGSPVTVLADPPRTGLEVNVIPTLTDLRPDRILYVSCDPATLARDVKRLAEAQYRVSAIEIIDLFPQTAHVECVVLLEREESRKSEVGNRE